MVEKARGKREKLAPTASEKSPCRAIGSELCHEE